MLAELDQLKAAHEARLYAAEAEGRVIDPLIFPRRYADPRDQEVAAFIAAGFAFGRISAFAPKLAAIFAALGPSPYAALQAFPARGQLLPGFVYRFVRAEDLHCFLYLIGQMLRDAGSLEAFFLRGHEPGKLRASISSFVERAIALPIDGFYESPSVPEDAGVRFFFSHPRTSAAKRMCLFLRWMVRDEAPDLGVWQGLSSSELVIPLDTHIMSQARRLEWIAAQGPTFRVAESITARLAAFSAADPLRYDFALCHDDISPWEASQALPARS